VQELQEKVEEDVVNGYLQDMSRKGFIKEFLVPDPKAAAANETPTEPTRRVTCLRLDPIIWFAIEAWKLFNFF